MNQRILAFSCNVTAAALPHSSVEHLKRAVKRFVAEGLAKPNLLRPATRRASSERLLTLVAGIAGANPDLTLAQIGAQLEAMYERTPRGGTRWSPSSIKSLLERARNLGSECSTPKKNERLASVLSSVVITPPPCVGALI